MAAAEKSIVTVDINAASSAQAPLSATAIAGLARIRDLIEAVRQQTRRWVWIESLALIGLAGAAVFFGTMAFDWAVEPPAWVRVLLVVLALVGLVALIWGKLWGRLAVSMGDATLASLLERGHVGFRDSLSTAVELSTGPAGDVDRRLLERTIDEAVAVVGDVEPARLFRRRRLVATALAGVMAVASIVGLACLRPAVADLWTRRMLLLDDTPWPRRTGLDAEGFSAGVRKVARGTDVDLRVRADAAREIPEVVDLRTRSSRGGPWRTERMGVRGGVADGAQAFGHLIKGVNEDLDVEIRGGDARLRGLRLVVVDAPALESLECVALLPGYLGGGTRAVSASRVLQVPRGSTVTLRFRATKPLRSATVVTVEDGVETRLAEVAEGSAGLPAQESASSVRDLAVELGPVEGERTLVARFTDTDGLDNREPISVVLSAVPDEAPQVAMRMRGISTAVTPQARIPLVGIVSDDHSLADAVATVAVKDGATVNVAVSRVKPGVPLVEFTEDRPEILELEPLALTPGAALSVQFAARDGCTLGGGPNEGKSDAWSLDVVTPEALMAMLEAREILLRRRFESVVSDLALARERLAAGLGGNAAVEDRAGGEAGEGGGAGSDVGESRAAASEADGWALESGRLAESASRAAGETGEIARDFLAIRGELDNNRMLTEELEGRLVGQIATPLSAIAAGDLPGLAAAVRAAPASEREAIVARADMVLARMRAVLDKMMELESYNEVIELLRGVIRTQEEIRSETLRRQRQRAKEALERP
ncbi:MAG: hypothetical protein DWI01_03355 [Planctomycetota bacterium]|nr:MAG: hypothetical protein DWI01_03355 [Planctomycetota bacterium]